MAATRVRISRAPVTAPAAGESALRRRPRQSRAQASSQALQEAFVRVLLDQGYVAMTVRELAGVAGVGIGTFYDYVSDKQALAALTIHRKVQALARDLVTQAEVLQGLPLGQLVPALVARQIAAIRSDARAWAALYQLERQISPPEAYRKNYRRYVEAWVAAVGHAGDAPDPAGCLRLGRAVHVLTYGAVVQALLTQGARVDWAALQADLGRSLQGHLAGG